MLEHDHDGPPAPVLPHEIRDPQDKFRHVDKVVAATNSDILKNIAGEFTPVPK